MDWILQYTEYRLSLQLWKFCPPVLLVLGTAGNLLTIIVLMQRRNRKTSYALYLTALAVSDIFVLWTGLFRQWLRYSYDIDLRTFSLTSCKLHLFLVYVSFQCSSWFLVAVTVDRLIGVLFPHKVRILCSFRNACSVIIFILVMLTLLNSHWFYGYTIKHYYINNTIYQSECFTTNDPVYKYFRKTWDWIDFFVVSLIPLVLLSVANIAIITRLVIRKHKMRVQVVPNAGTSVPKREELSQLTTMLLTVNFVFIICSTPMSVYNIGYSIWYNEVKTYHDLAILLLWWAIVNMFAYLNSTLNFVLYFLSGSKFRQEVKDFFCERQRSLGHLTASVRTQLTSAQARQVNTISGNSRSREVPS